MPPNFDDMMQRAMSGCGDDGVYTPNGGQAVTVKVMPSSEDRMTPFGGGRVIRSEGATFEILKSAVAAPARGDALLFRGVNYTVKAVTTPDPEAIVWEIDCARA